MRRLGLLTFLCFCITLSANAQTAHSVTPMSNRSTLEQVKDFSLKGDARSAFRKFRRKAKYFGSIYVNRPERLAGSFSNVNSSTLADYYARAYCQAQSRNPKYCVLYARVVPRNYDPSDPGITLSREANKEFKEYLRLQSNDRFGAFAASDNGAVGFSWAEASRDIAEREALKRCSKSTRKLMRDVPKMLRPLVALPSHHGCRLLHMSR